MAYEWQYTVDRAIVSDAAWNQKVSTTTNTELGYVSGVTSAIQTQLNSKQTLDATLTALAWYNTNWILTQTAADTFVGRTITAWTGIVITNGSGVSWNPTIEIDTTSDNNTQVENFIQNTTWSVIQFTSTTWGGGSNTAISPENQNNWNGATAYGRFGISSIWISTNSNSRSSLSTTANFTFLTNSNFLAWSERSVTWWQIDFANDPVLQCVWFMDVWTVANPVLWVYHRAPRTGESAFLKYVVRTASTETVASTSIAYDATASRYLKTYIQRDGATMTFVAMDWTTTSTDTIATFLVTHPAFVGVALSQWMSCNRNGAPAVGVARSENYRSQTFTY